MYTLGGVIGYELQVALGDGENGLCGLTDEDVVES